MLDAKKSCCPLYGKINAAGPLFGQIWLNIFLAVKRARISEMAQKRAFGYETAHFA